MSVLPFLRHSTVTRYLWSIKKLVTPNFLLLTFQNIIPSEVGREYRDFLTTQLDDLYDDMKHDYTVFFYSIKRFFDKRIEDSDETTTLALLVLIISMATYFQIKEEDFSNYVSEQFRCHYVMKSNYISNIARHATMFLNSFKHDNVELVFEKEPDIQAAWDILDYKLSHVKINLVDDIK